MRVRVHSMQTRPSPSMVVALIALFVALSGVAVAASALDKQERKAVNKIAKKKAKTTFNKLAPDASVNAANTAANADLLDNLDSTDFLRSNARAGGDLTGSYPSPSLAAAAVGTGELATLPAARVFNGSSISIDDDTFTELALDSESFDTANLHSTSSNPARLTAPVAGTYVVSGQVVWSANTTGLREMYLRMNGDTTIAFDVRAAMSPGSTAQSTATVTRLAPGEFVTLRVYQNSGGDLPVDATNSFFSGSQLAMAWIGP